MGNLCLDLQHPYESQVLQCAGESSGGRETWEDSCNPMASLSSQISEVQVQSEALFQNRVKG